MSMRRLATVGSLVPLLFCSTISAVHAGHPEPGGGHSPVPQLGWEACGLTPEAAAAECARALLPLDYDDPGGEQVEIAVARVPATDPDQRIGSLFINFGGPGGPAVDYLQEVGAGLFGALNQRFDIVAFDPRGVGQSTPAVDCGLADQPVEPVEPDEPLVPEFPTPDTVDREALVAANKEYVAACLAANGELLEHVSTANVARDMDALRAGLGEKRLNYLGYSYGTLIGATYASLFPDRYRALVLDGAIDPDVFLNDPVEDARSFIAGFEDALDRFLDACAADQVACSGFGGDDPAGAYDALLARAEATPLPVVDFPEAPNPVTAAEIRVVTGQLLYAKQAWGLLAQALAAAEAGDGTAIRAILVALSEGGLSGDAFTAITASEQRWPDDIDAYFENAAGEYADFPHFWWLGSYSSLVYALWPVHDEDSFTGPFTADPDAPPVLVIGTTHDPATPYADAVALTEQLGNARLITMDGDGHTAYGGNSPCIDSATDSYLVSGVLPAEGTVCSQEVPFAAPEPPPVEDTALMAALLRPLTAAAMR